MERSRAGIGQEGAGSDRSRAGAWQNRGQNGGGGSGQDCWVPWPCARALVRIRPCTFSDLGPAFAQARPAAVGRGQLPHPRRPPLQVLRRAPSGRAGALMRIPICGRRGYSGGFGSAAAGGACATPTHEASGGDRRGCLREGRPAATGDNQANPGRRSASAVRRTLAGGRRGCLGQHRPAAAGKT